MFELSNLERMMMTMAMTTRSRRRGLSRLSLCPGITRMMMIWKLLNALLSFACLAFSTLSIINVSFVAVEGFLYHSTHPTTSFIEPTTIRRRQVNVILYAATTDVDDNDLIVTTISCNSSDNSNTNKSTRRRQQRSYSGRDVCNRCFRPIPQCVCKALPPDPLHLSTLDILVVQHPQEFRKRKTVSTVPFMKLVLPNNVQTIVGATLDVASSIIDNAISGGRQPLLLFPGPDAMTIDDIGQHYLQEIDHDVGADSNNKFGHKSYLLILVDGTWGQARRMVRDTSIDVIQNKCRMVKFSNQDNCDSNNSSDDDNDDEGSTTRNVRSVQRSTYGSIRQQPNDFCLSTLEASAKSILSLTANTDYQEGKLASQYLLDVLNLFVQIQIGHHQKQQQERIINEYNRHKIQSDVYYLRTLEVTDAKFVNENWLYQSKKSLKMIRNYIDPSNNNTFNMACLGIEDTRTTQLVACIIRYPYTGALGMLYVDENYRRNGLASMLVDAAVKIIQSCSNNDKTKNEHVDEECYCLIRDGNLASESLFAGQGFVLTEEDVGKKRGTGRRRPNRKWIFPSKKKRF